MGVRDVTTLARKTVLIVNSDVAASQQVADRYCAMYGIPVANQFVYAMGSAVVWPYAAGRFAGFWTDLKAKVDSVGAYAVFSTAGCPVGVTLEGFGGGADAPVNFAHLVGFVKRIIALGYEPYGLASGGDRYPMKVDGTALYDSVSNHRGTQSAGYDGAALAVAMQVGADAEHTSAGGSTSQEYHFTTYRTEWNGNYSIMDTLLTGHVGHYTSSDASHSASLWDLSRVVLGKAGNLQKPIAEQTGTVLACMGWIGTNLGYSATSKQALVAKRMRDAGLDLRYWYYSNQTVNPGSAADNLLPISGSETWTKSQLDATPPTATPTCTYTFGFGHWFENNAEVTWEDTLIPEPTGGLLCGGASFGNVWGKRVQSVSGFSHIHHMGAAEYGFHQGEKVQSKICDIWLALLAGRSLAEAAYVGLEYSFLAVGDPLCKPFPS